jgi:predicted RND superfamily exporter protein
MSEINAYQAKVCNMGRPLHLYRQRGMDIAKSETFLPQYARWIIGHRWWVLGLCLGFVIISGAGLMRLSMTADYRVFFNKEDPYLIALESFETTYGKMDTILFVVKPADEDVFTAETLAALHDMTAEAWQVPYAIRVDSITNFQYTRAEQDDIIVADLVEDPNDLSAAELEKIRSVALNEPALNGRLVADDAAAAGIVVTLQLPGTDHTEQVPQSVEAARVIAANAMAAYPKLQIGLTGLALMSYAEIEVIRRDLATLVPVMFAVIVVLLLALLRSVMGMAACLVVIVFSVLPATGIFGWLGLQINQASAMAPVVIMTLAIADCVHVLMTAFQAMSEGRSKHEALVESLRINAQPVFLTSLTTVIGFLSLNFSDAQPFRELGNFTALGVLMAWIMAMTALPALMAVLPIAPKRLAIEENAMSMLGDFVVVQRRKLLLGFGALALLVVAMIPTIEIEDRFVEWFDESTTFRQDTDLATQHLVGPYVMEISVPSGQAGGVADVAYLQKLESLHKWLEEQNSVVHVTGLVDVLKRLNRSMHGDDPAWYRLPDSRELAAQFILLYEMSLPYGLDLNSQIDIDKSASRLTVTLDDVSSKQLRQIEHDTVAWISASLPPSMQTKPTGIALIFAHISQRNIEGMLWGTAIAFVIISIVITIALKEIRMGLISLVSNCLPVLITFGLWAVFVGEIGIIASVITATTLGLIVDDTVHFLSKYRRAKREHRINTHDAVRFSFDHVGSALCITTAVLVSGFAVLTLSVFALNVELGVLTAITLVNALVLDLLLLPGLILWMDEQEVCNCRTCSAAFCERLTA